MRAGTRRLLERHGYDTSEVSVITTESACGAAVFGYLMNRGQLPITDPTEKDQIATYGNSLLEQFGLPPEISRAVVDHVIEHNFKV